MYIGRAGEIGSAGTVALDLVAIIGAVALLLLYVVRQSADRAAAEPGDSALRESHSTAMVMDGRAYLNHAILDMLDYHEDEALLLDLRDLFPPDAGATGSGADALAALLEGRPVVEQFDARLRKKNGEPVDVVLAATRISFAGKNGVILIAKDVTTHKQLEEERLGGRRSGGALADQIDLGVFRVSVGRRLFTDANPVARRLFGLPDAGDLSATTSWMPSWSRRSARTSARRNPGAVSARIAW
jgi:PAS domain S-box-containing protein